jgi:hypothetical protein
VRQHLHHAWITGVQRPVRRDDRLHERVDRLL